MPHHHHRCESVCICHCRKPCLVLKLQSQAGFSVRLIPAIEPDAFPLAKLAPERNSLRLATAAAMPATAAAAQPTSAAKGQKRKREDAAAVVAKGDASFSGTRGSVDATRLPTPQYNTSIVTDMLAEGHQQVLQSAFEAVPGLREAVVLLKVMLFASHCVLQVIGYGAVSKTARRQHGFVANSPDRLYGHIQAACSSCWLLTRV